MKKSYPEKDAVMQCHTQSGNITNHLKVEVDFTLHEISAMGIMMWRFHVDESSKGRYYMILGWDILIWLRLSLKLSGHIIKADDGTFKGSTTPMVDMGTYEFKYLNIGKITPE